MDAMKQTPLVKLLFKLYGIRTSCPRSKLCEERDSINFTKCCISCGRVLKCFEHKNDVKEFIGKCGLKICEIAYRMREP
jgi:hypothetical protein